MGVVYKALDLQSDEHVAVKFIRTYGNADLDQLARFRIEAEAVAFLRHQNIVPVVKMGVAKGYPYIVLEYVSGGSLVNTVREGSLGPVRAASIAEGIARGLAHSHRLSILHRDLKPQNILLTDTGIPRITDFGLAKITATGRARQHLRDASIVPGIDRSLLELVRFGGREEGISPENMKQRIEETVDLAWQDHDPSLGDAITLSDVREFVTKVVKQSFEAPDDPFGQEEDAPTREGQIIGTPMYMAPEQTFGDMSQLGRHTDLYSLGVILYEMLSGNPPHTATRIVDLFQQIRSDSPPPLHRSVPLTLRTICANCLAKSPGDRYQSADSLADDLDAFLESDEAKLATGRASVEGRFLGKAGNFVRRILRFPNF
jgi:serine/threonine protein kinase